MSTVKLHTAGDKTVSLEDALVTALTSPVESQRIIGRAVASGYPKKLADWVQSELERGTDETELLVTIISLQVQEMASFCAVMMRASGDATVARIMADMALQRLPEFAANIRAREKSAPAAPSG